MSKQERRVNTIRCAVYTRKSSEEGPRISRLMALAIRFEDLIRSGEVEDHSALAALGHVTPVRISQIASLNNLAPDLQEALLFYEPVAGDREAIAERHVRAIALEPDWVKQREVWGMLRAERAAATICIRNGSQISRFPIVGT